jgi:hypothetical protein
MAMGKKRVENREDFGKISKLAANKAENLQ